MIYTHTIYQSDVGVDSQSHEGDDGCCGVRASMQYAMFDVNIALQNRIWFVDESLPADCAQIQHGGADTDGVYTIYPGGQPLQVYCDLTTDRGGWTVRGYVY